MRCAVVCLTVLLGPDLGGAQTPPRVFSPRVVGHRGLLHHAPENTVAGFGACVELRLGFELDVRRTKDGHLVCIHDAVVDRTTNGKGRVGDLTIEALGKLDAGGWFGPSFTGEKVPTLDAVLQRAASGWSLIALDIKEEDEEEDVVQLVRKHKLSEQCVAIGLTIERPKVRHRLRKADAKLGVAVLAQTAKDLKAALADADANWIYVRFVPTLEQAAQIHKLGKKVFIAGTTVMGLEEKNWTSCRDAGVDAILTDYPLECRKTLERR